MEGGGQAEELMNRDDRDEVGGGRDIQRFAVDGGLIGESGFGGRIGRW